VTDNRFVLDASMGRKTAWQREVSVPHTRLGYITGPGPSASAKPIWTRLSIRPVMISDSEFDNKNET